MNQTLDRDLVANMQVAAAVLRGEQEPACIPPPTRFVQLTGDLARLGLSLTAFAQRFGLAVTAISDQEQGRRCPDAGARVLLLVIARSPDVVAAAVMDACAA